MHSELLLRVYPDLLFAWRDQSLLATNRDGAIDGVGLQGLFEHDTRLLSKWRLQVHGRSPRLVANTAVEPHSTSAHFVAPLDAEADAGNDALGLPLNEYDRELALHVRRFVGRGMHEHLQLANYAMDVTCVALTWEAAGDFADLAEARGGSRNQDAPVSVAWQVSPLGHGNLRLDYQHPQLSIATDIRFSVAAPTQPPEKGEAGFSWDGTRVTCTLAVRPRENRQVCIVVSAVMDGEMREPLFGCSAFDSTEQSQPVWTTKATRLRTSNFVVQRAWDRAVADFAALALGDTPDGLTATPAAGVPLYATLFGRDALTASGQALLASPEVAEDTLRAVARHIGTRDDDFFDEQPGRVPQQLRQGPLARLRITPWLHDYGDYAAPCAFLVLLGAHHMVRGDLDLIRELREPAERVLGWLEERADIDGDGFLDYRTRSPKGQKHQGWKDAGNAVVDAEGRQVDPPIAPCEIQGYWYAARLMMSEIYLSLGEPSRALDLFRQAADLKRRFNERFWLTQERFIAFGLDGQKRQIASIVSNAAHCLATGILDGEHAEDVVRRLLAPDMFSGWGIRTLSADNPAYNPFKYHLGSVWPVENATAALGMKRYGFAAEASRVAGAMFDATTLFEHARLPETFGGLPREPQYPHPGIYPDACAPQAWSATAVFWFVQAMLGLWTYAPLNAVIVEPELPEWLPELTLRDLRVKDARISIQFKRDRKGKTDYRVLGRRGTVRVVRQPAPEDRRAGPAARVRELVESLLPGH